MTSKKFLYIALAVIGILSVSRLYSNYKSYAKTTAQSALAFPFVKLEKPKALGNIAFTRLTADGKIESVTLKSLAGKVVMVCFWRTDCTFCHKELQELGKIAKTYGNDVAVIPVAQDTADNMKELAQILQEHYENHSISGLDLFIDPSYELLKTFDPRGTPMTYVISPKGQLVGRSEGKYFDMTKFKQMMRAFNFGQQAEA